MFLKKEIVFTILKTLSVRHHKDMLPNARVSQLLTSAVGGQSSPLVFQCSGHLKWNIQNKNCNFIPVLTVLSQLSPHAGGLAISSCTTPKQQGSDPAHRLLIEPAVRTCTIKPPATTAWNRNTYPHGNTWAEQLTNKLVAVLTHCLAK